MSGPDELWVADMTCIGLNGGFVYLAAIVDAYSRRCLGCAYSRSPDSGLVMQALDQALELRGVRSGLIHHSDRGAVYTARVYTERLSNLGIMVSMSRGGNPYDNALMESFFKTLKLEEVNQQEYRTIEELRSCVGGYIERYNQGRLHSSLGYHSPAEFESLHYHKHSL